MPPMSDRPLRDPTDATPVEATDAVPVDAEIVDTAGASALEGPVGPEETVDGMPVLAEVRAIEVASGVSLPAVQAAAVAATGFVAGAATIALVRRHSARKLARARPVRRGLDALPIVGTRSFLVDVHLISKPGE
jgi:hypothetical protein